MLSNMLRLPRLCLHPSLTADRFAISALAKSE
jgi:hypothetical protein